MKTFLCDTVTLSKPLTNTATTKVVSWCIGKQMKGCWPGAPAALTSTIIISLINLSRQMDQLTAND